MSGCASENGLANGAGLVGNSANTCDGDMTSLPPIRSWLYAPGSSRRILDRVFGAGADAVILDLEDSVRQEDKAAARRLVSTVLSRHVDATLPVFVRINHPRMGMLAGDLAASVGPGLMGLRVPKVEGGAEVRALEEVLRGAEDSAGIRAGRIVVVCGLESARGVVLASEIASSSQRVAALSFGEVDYLADVQGYPTPGRSESLYARSQLVVSSRLAGIAPPVDSAYLEIDDDDGLRRSCHDGKALGFSGRGAVHPRQVPIINREYTPSADEVAAAQIVIAAASNASGAFRMPSGEFVDAAVIRRARSVVQLADEIARRERARQA